MQDSVNVRIERDSLGEMEIPAGALYGIHAMRAMQNFPDTTPFQPEWYKAVGLVKLACYRTYRSFSKAVAARYPGENLPLQLISPAVIDALEFSAREVSQGKYADHFIVPAVSGGAGTSINMNINEIIANASLLRMGEAPGAYHLVDPIEAANVCQSTNDVIPTALRVAVMKLLPGLEASVNDLRQSVEACEVKFRDELRVGYTQMQEAVPSSFGKLFSSYSEALSRDWWRISKCFERIKVVNLGGGATGTGMGIPRFFIMEVVPELQNITDLPVTRSENLPDATSNLDSFVEVHAILKSLAVNLEKIVSDLRLLASDVAGSALQLPQRQVGSSIMPGKVNPVIPEFVISASHKVYANDQLTASLCAQGCLDLNAYLPLIGHAVIESIKLLAGSCNTMRTGLFDGLAVSPGVGADRLFRSPAITTALSPVIGYNKAALLARKMKEDVCDIREANKALGLIAEEDLRMALKPENLLRTGYTLNDIKGDGDR